VQFNQALSYSKETVKLHVEYFEEKTSYFQAGYFTIVRDTYLRPAGPAYT